MTDNVNVEDSVSGADIPVAADDVGGVAFQKVKLDIGADGATSGTAGTSSVPLRVDPTGTTTQPVSLASAPLGTGAATAANQTTLIGHLDGVEGLLGTIDGDTGNISTKIDTLAGAVSGTEMQVDVLTMPTVTVQDGGGSITVDGTVTANAGTNLNTSALALDATLSTTSTRIGDLTESAPGTDTASSGLNGRLQRIAQRLTSLIALLPTSLGQKTSANSFAVTVASDQSAVAVSAASLPLPSGAATETTLGTRLTESDFDTKVGSLTESAPGTDTASSGLNGRLQRIAQLLTTIIARNPTSLGQKTMANSFGVVVASDQTAVPVSGTVTVDSELTTADLDTGAGTDTRAVVGLVGSKSGGGALIPGDATAGLKVDLGADNDVTVTGSVTANAGTNLNTSTLALEAGGNLAGAAASLAVMDDWDESDRAKVNLIAGQAGIAGGTGTDGATVPRVTLATNVALPAGTNNIGDVDVLTLPALPAGTNNIGDVDVLTIAAGTNNIGRVGASVVEIAGTINGANTIAAAGDYAALDVFSHTTSAGSGVSWSFASIARESGGSGVITRALIMSTAETMTARVRLWLFNGAPTTATEMDDNAAFLLDEDDYTKLVGWIDFPSFERAGAAGEVAVALNDTVRLAFKCSADANLRGITQFIDAETNEAASMTIHIRLQATQD